MILSDAELADARAMQVQAMTSTLRIWRDAGEPRWDEATESMTPAQVTVYEGVARVAYTATQPRAVDAAGEPVVVVAHMVTVPWDVTGVRDGDLVDVFTCPDPDAVGERLVVAGVGWSDYDTARRLTCRANT